jgi:D-sedoheptulose 7-phosphate isomerase
MFEKRVDEWLDTLAGAPRSTVVTDHEGTRLELAAAIATVIERGHAAHEAGRKLIFAGNGASATISSHMATDFSKNGGMRSLALNDSAMLTTLSNDIGYAEVFSRQIGYYAQAGDILIAAAAAREAGCGVVTFSGFGPDNPLRATGDLNFHVPVEEYGFVEVAHLALIHAILDLSLGWGTEEDRNPGALKRRAANAAE